MGHSDPVVGAAVAIARPVLERARAAPFLARLDAALERSAAEPPTPTRTPGTTDGKDAGGRAERVDRPVLTPGLRADWPAGQPRLDAGLRAEGHASWQRAVDAVTTWAHP